MCTPSNVDAVARSRSCSKARDEEKVSILYEGPVDIYNRNRVPRLDWYPPFRAQDYHPNFPIVKSSTYPPPASILPGLSYGEALGAILLPLSSKRWLLIRSPSADLSPLRSMTPKGVYSLLIDVIQMRRCQPTLVRMIDSMGKGSETIILQFTSRSYSLVQLRRKEKCSIE